ncbi:MAG: DUF4347 domain-containing protein, partial [Gammaproteobacteria bacterium]
MARRVVFIDASLASAALPDALDGSGLRVVLIDAASDPLQQIAAALASEQNVAAVEILSHGGPGVLLLGGRTVTADSLLASADVLSQWKSALAPGADILLYGCEAASGGQGARLLEMLSLLTGADVAASSDPSGNPDSGGNWTLENSTGATAEGVASRFLPALASTLAVVTGDGSDNSLTGTAGDDSIYGLGGNDTLDGGTGADLLDGGEGTDSLVGGIGDDTYVTDGLETLVEASGEGTDTVRSSVSATLGANFENLVLAGTGFLAGTGNALANAITGNNSGNRLEGGGGADTLTGALGDDNYYIDGLDTVVELPGEGTDTAFSAESVTLGANIEVLFLTGSSPVSGTGNATANTILGNDAGNVLSGAGGSDTLIGEQGDDLYIVDGADTVTENPGEGSDAVQASASFTLPDHVENLTLTGTAAIDGAGNDLPNLINGNSAANLLSGGGGYDILTGGLGDDTYVDDGEDTLQEIAGQGTDTILASRNFTLPEFFEVLTLTGSADLSGTGGFGRDRINGNAGNNTLDGAFGVDTLTGGAGDDVFIVETAGESVSELAGEGTDTVRSAASFTLGANLENLQLTGGARIDGIGNSLANRIDGNAWANRLEGGEGNDTLAGASGIDTLVGGAGDDRFIIGDTVDTVIEAAGEGTDTVESTVSVTLAANVENLLLGGQSALNGTGNGLPNRLTGNSAANVLDGSGG